MTSNNDDFDHDQFDATDPSTDGEPTGGKQGLMEAWRNKPLFKLLVIMIGVSGALALVLGTTSSNKAPPVSVISKTPGLNEPPGGPVSPVFKENNDLENLRRAEVAAAQGGSVIPTPIGRNANDIIEPAKKDPLKQLHEETERMKLELRNEQAQNAEKLRVMQQQMVTQNARPAQPEDDTLARAMQKQMQQLMDGWAPRTARFVDGVKVDEKQSMMQQAGMQQAALDASQNDQSKPVEAKTLVPAGTVNYIQLLTEANSDVPGPILAQILSGPLAGGRAIGHFQVMNDYLVMTFNMVSYKGKDFSINGLALDPDTTLGGMATEVDHRYLTRILLPAASSFISAFGSALSETSTTTTAQDGVLFSDNAKRGSKEAMYSGIGKVGDTMAQFFEQQANQTKTLVRVAVGSPMGLFFLQPVTDQKAEYSRSSSQYESSRTSLGSGSVPYPDADGSESRSNSGTGMSAAQMEMYNQMMSSMSPSTRTRTPTGR